MNTPVVLTSEQSRAVDRIAIEQYAVPGLVLMENAGRGSTALLLQEEPKKVVIVCGKGNNAGDGFVIARHLDNAGVSVEILMLVPLQDLSGDARTNCEIVHKFGLSTRVVDPSCESESIAQSLRQADWIVDALLGTGIRGEVREPFARMIDLVNHAGKPIFAVDIPSGLDADTGEVLGHAINATRTATFVTLKTGLMRQSGPHQAGSIDVVSIGVPDRIVDDVLNQTP
ncbi:NAD(P)H-hydrate epimerase [Rubinisphaera margarita]|uniref:NAD(P)H-hydrate epimerase n=1 Tax=Rubinisphaera margarita TaxID=2909586 RepID=UPI001EE9603D|nr:NAD(P)H-hydrate epimerase [Rubinisphaera margarita]MCG6155527.1 NAD(P)H-hydrate epimerase [Rubinisphaera margarita]